MVKEPAERTLVLKLARLPHMGRHVGAWGDSACISDVESSAMGHD